MLVRLLILIALISWHANSPSGRAAYFAGAYSLLLLVIGALGLMAGGDFTVLAVMTLLRFGVAFGLFWLLDRFEGMVGWALAIVGAVALAAFL
jgi:hypothetical protein